MRHVKAFTLVLCGLAGAASAGVVNAAVDDGAPSVAVRYNAQNLSTDQGARALYRQIVRAAEQVCPAPSDSRLVASAVLQCRAHAVANAVSKIDNARLAALDAGSAKRG